jgi:hypothetical protein
VGRLTGKSNPRIVDDFHPSRNHRAWVMGKTLAPAVAALISSHLTTLLMGVVLFAAKALYWSAFTIQTARRQALTLNGCSSLE